MKIGIFGATFDPPHYGHLIAAEFSMSHLRLDEIILIPANRNPLKQDQIPAPPQFRLEMIKAAVDGSQCYKVDDVELRRGGNSYMIDTFMNLQKEYSAGKSEFYLLLGADSAKDFAHWKDYQTLAKLCKPIIFNRPGSNLSKVAVNFPADCSTLEIPMIEISSTMIRNRISEGKSIKFLTPDPVIEIIEREKLYRSNANLTLV